MARKTRDTGLDAAERLRRAELRPTRQRMELVGLLFGAGHRHVTAEQLHGEAGRAAVRVSLATVYNTLHLFTRVGLLRQVMVDSARNYFDTNTGEHQHFFVEDEARLIDIPNQTVAVAGVPAPPKGTRVERIDVVVRVRRS